MRSRLTLIKKRQLDQGVTNSLENPMVDLENNKSKIEQALHRLHSSSISLEPSDQEKINLYTEQLNQLLEKIEQDTRHLQLTPSIPFNQQKKRISSTEENSQPIKKSNSQVSVNTQSQADWQSDDDASDLESDTDLNLSPAKGKKYVILYRGISFAQTRYSKEEKTALKKKKQIGNVLFCEAAKDRCKKKQDRGEDAFLAMGMEIRHRLTTHPYLNTYMQMYTNQYSKFRSLAQLEFDNSNQAMPFARDGSALAKTLFEGADSPELEVLSTTLSAHEACKYAMGDRFASKNLANTFQAPSYGTNGKPKHRTMGRVSLFILSLKDFKNSNPYYVRRAFAQNKIKPKFTHVQSQEVVFSGFIEQSFMYYDLPIIMPDFSKPFCNTYVDKYGMTKTEYLAYQAEFQDVLSPYILELFERKIFEQIMSYITSKLEKKAKSFLAKHKALQVFPSLKEKQFQEKNPSFQDVLSLKNEAKKLAPKKAVTLPEALSKKKQPLTNAMRDLKKIEDLILEKQFEQALSQLKDIKEEIPEGPIFDKYLLALIQCYSSLDKPHKARDMLAKLHPESPYHILAKTMIESTCSGESKEQVFIEELTQLVEIDENTCPLKDARFKVLLAQLPSVQLSKNMLKSHEKLLTETFPRMLLSKANGLYQSMTQDKVMNKANINKLFLEMPLILNLISIYDSWLRKLSNDYGIQCAALNQQWSAKFSFGNPKTPALSINRAKVISSVQDSTRQILSACLNDKDLMKDQAMQQSLRTFIGLLKETTLIDSQDKLFILAHQLLEQPSDYKTRSPRSFRI